jgi:hypothetical protein
MSYWSGTPGKSEKMKEGIRPESLFAIPLSLGLQWLSLQFCKNSLLGEFFESRLHRHRADPNDASVAQYLRDKTNRHSHQNCSPPQRANQRLVEETRIP